MSDQRYLEGRNPILEALKSGREIEKIMIVKGMSQGSINKIKEIAKDKKIIVQYVHRNKIDSLSTTGSHQGVMALVQAYEYKTVDDIMDVARLRNEDPFIIILDEIEDPHNLGSILRTAECCGAHGIIIPKRRSVGLTAVVAKTSAGAVEYLPVARVTNISKTIDELKMKGVWIFGTDMNGEAYYYEQSLKGSICIVIGNEGKGISRLVRDKCDFLLKIPMKGKISSLNASVAAAVMMYEVVKQRELDK